MTVRFDTSAYGRVKIMHRALARALVITAILVTVPHGSVCAADKLRVAYVSPSVSLSLPWVAKELRDFAKHDLVAEILLITGSPRLVQSLIAGDVDVVFAGVTAFTRARLRGAEVAILGAAANLSSQKLLVSRNSKIRRLEEVKGATLGVSQFGSEADTFTRNALATVGTATGSGCNDSATRRPSAGRRRHGGGENGSRRIGRTARAHCGARGREASQQRCRAEDPFALRHIRDDAQLYSAQENRCRSADALIRRSVHFLKTNRSGSITLCCRNILAA